MNGVTLRSQVGSIRVNFYGLSSYFNLDQPLTAWTFLQNLVFLTLFSAPIP